MPEKTTHLTLTFREVERDRIVWPGSKAQIQPKSQMLKNRMDFEFSDIGMYLSIVARSL
ncbi:MAG: hypothetical protein HC819_09475 [Cyclobacteriaceae bacterium]|nr:hypothetical protein [Cyclobacteriaceae bacterium]